MVEKESLLIEIFGVNYNKINFKIKNTKINKNDYTILNSKLVYNLKLKDFLNEEEEIDPLINFNLGTGNFNKKIYEKFNKETTLNINEPFDTYARGFSIFNSETKGLEYHNKIYLKYNEELDIYVPVYFQGIDDEKIII